MSDYSNNSNRVAPEQDFKFYNQQEQPRQSADSFNFGEEQSPQERSQSNVQEEDEKVHPLFQRQITANRPRDANFEASGGQFNNQLTSTHAVPRLVSKQEESQIIRQAEEYESKANQRIIQHYQTKDEDDVHIFADNQRSDNASTQKPNSASQKTLLGEQQNKNQNGRSVRSTGLAKSQGQSGDPGSDSEQEQERPECENETEVEFNLFKFTYNLEGVEVEYHEEFTQIENYKDLVKNKIDQLRFANPEWLKRQQTPLALLKLNENLQAEKMVPFNQAGYTQTLQIPKNEAFGAYQGKLLTVQFCQQTVKAQKPSKMDQEQDNDIAGLTSILRFYCGKDGCDAKELNEIQHPSIRNELKDPDEVQYKKCQQCGDEEEDRYFICTKQHKTCQACMIDLLKAKLLKAKTSNHFDFEKYYLKPIRKEINVGQTNKQLIDLFLQQDVQVEQQEVSFNVSRQRTVNMTAKQIRNKELEGLNKQLESSAEFITDFSQYNQLATLERDEAAEADDQTQGNSFALIGIWSKQPNTQQNENYRYLCEGTVHIQNPLFLKPNQDSHKSPFKVFLHLNEDKDRIFYFKQEEQDIIEMYYLNLKRIKERTSSKVDSCLNFQRSEEGQNLLKELFQRKDEDDFRNKSTIKTQKMPRLFRWTGEEHEEENILGNEPNQVLEEFHFYGCDKPQSQKNMSVEDRIDSKNPEGNFLVVHSDSLMEFDERENQWEWKEDANGDRDNVHFIKVEEDNQPPVLLFTIELCDFFIGSRFSYLYFLKDRSIMYWRWGSNKYCSVRCAAKIKGDTKEIARKQNDFQFQFDDAVANAWMIEGYVHQNDLDEYDCVTLNFRGKGLFTFRTKSKDDKMQNLEENEIQDIYDNDEEVTHKKSYSFFCDGYYYEKIGKNHPKRDEDVDDIKIFKKEITKNGITQEKKFEKYSVEFEIFQNNEKITTMNFRVDNKKVESIPIEKNFTLGLNNIFSLWIVLDDDQQPIELKGILTENPKDKSYTFVQCETNQKGQDHLFEIDLDYQPLAQSKFNLEKVTDAVVQVEEDENGNQNIYAYGNTKVAFDENDYGYNVMTVTRFLIASQDAKAKGKKAEKIVFRCEEGFGVNKDENGRVRLPQYILMPFEIDYLTDNNKVFRTQLFYQDWTTSETLLQFLQCLSKPNTDESNEQQSVSLWPQWSTLPSEDMIVSYPLIAYKSNNPMDNEIVIGNLARNVPQKIIDLAPFRFVAFIHSGLQQNSADVNTHIYILGQRTTQNDKKVFRILKYSQFPYDFPPGTKDTKDFYVDGLLSYLTGVIYIEPLKNGGDDNALCREKIRCCQMLESERVGGNSVLLVLQLVDRIYCLSCNKNKTWDSTSILDNDRSRSQIMLKFLMQRGPDQEIYYIEKNRDSQSQQIMRLTYPMNEPHFAVMETFHSEKILAFSLLGEGDVRGPELQQHSLNVLTNKFKYQKYIVENKDSPLKLALTLDLKAPRFEPVFAALDEHYTAWPSVIFNERGLVSFIQHAGTLTSALVSFQGEFSLGKDFLKDDSKLNRILVTQVVPWVNQELQQVREEDFHYWLIQKSVFARQIDFLKPDQLLQLITGSGGSDVEFAELQIIGNEYIGVKVNSDIVTMTLLFSQRTHQFVKSLPYRHLVQLSLCEDNTQFFGASSTDDGLEVILKFEGTKCTKLPIEKVFEVLLGREIFDRDYSELLPEDLLQMTVSNISDAENQQVTFFEIYPLSKDTFSESEIQDNCFFLEKISDDFTFSDIKADILQLDDQQNQGQNREEDEDGKWPDNEEMKIVCFRLCINKVEFEPKDIKIFFTQDFLVIANLKDIYWIHVSQLNDKNFPIQLEKQKCGDWNLNGGGIYKSQNFSAIEFDRIDSRIKEQGFQVHPVSRTNIQIAEKGEIRQNLIQISFCKVSIIWDLNYEENREVTFVERLDQLYSYQGFTQTGMLPHHTVELKEDASLMRRASFTLTNEKGTLMYNPRSPGNLVGTFFSNFALIDLLEIMNLISEERENRYVPQIDPLSTVANFNGLTFFEIFSGTDTTYIELLEEQLNSMTLEQQTEETGVKLDNILIRQIYHTMQLPCNVLGNNQYNLLGQYDKSDAYFKNPISQRPLQSKDTTAKILSYLFNLVTLKLLSKPKKIDENVLLQLKSNILQKQLQGCKYHQLDPLLRIIMKSKETKLSNLVANIQHFKNVYSIKSKQMDAFLGDARLDNQITTEVWTLEIIDPHNQKMISFASNTSLLSEQEIQREVEGVQRKQKIKGTAQTTQVSVEILEMEWISEYYDLVNFYKFISAQSAEKFSNDLIITVLSQEKYKLGMYIVFAFYVVFMILSVVYFSIYLFESDENQPQKQLISSLILITSLILVFFEIGTVVNGIDLEVEDQGQSILTKVFQIVWNFIKTFFNSLIMLTIIFFTNYVISQHTDDVNEPEKHKALAQIASVIVVFEWFILIYWLRIKKQLSIYVILVFRTIKDIAWFFVLFLICVFMFANAIYILNKSRKQLNTWAIGKEEGNELDVTLFPEAFGYDFIDAILNQYMLGIGEFFIDNFEGNHHLYMWMFFIAATLLTQVLFLNMLVAVMARTLDQVNEIKEEIIRKSFCQLVTNTLWLSRKYNSGVGIAKHYKRYLYIIQPEIQAEEDTETKQDQIQDYLKEIDTQVKEAESQIGILDSNHQRLLMNVDNLQDSVLAIQEKLADQNQLLAQVLK